MILQSTNLTPFLSRKRTINCRGRLVDFSTPVVMGVINITPDSFYAASRYNMPNEILKQVESIINSGGTIIDLGACSSRPGSGEVALEDEIKRLMPALELIRKNFPDIIISIDTYRAAVAEKVIIEGEADMINDISGGEMDEAMFDTIARLNVPYVLVHMLGKPLNMQDNPVYKDVIADISLWLARKVHALRAKGVNDIIIDPGFGFGKTIAHNFELLAGLDQFKLFELPILVGFSRKSMIYRTLDIDPSEALNGTTVLNTLALTKGVDILRVHDVNEAVQCIKLMRNLNYFAS